MPAASAVPSPDTPTHPHSIAVGSKNSTEHTKTPRPKRTERLRFCFETVAGAPSTPAAARLEFTFAEAVSGAPASYGVRAEHGEQQQTGAESRAPGLGKRWKRMSWCAWHRVAQLLQMTWSSQVAQMYRF